MFRGECAGSVSAEVTVDVPKFPCTSVVVCVLSDDVAIRAMVSVRQSKECCDDKKKFEFLL